MDIATFHAGRRFAEVKSGRIAYFEQGRGAGGAVHPRRAAQRLSLAPYHRSRSSVGGAASPST